MLRPFRLRDDFDLRRGGSVPHRVRTRKRERDRADKNVMHDCARDDTVDVTLRRILMPQREIDNIRGLVL